MVTGESVLDNIRGWEAGREKLDIDALYIHLEELYGPFSPTNYAALSLSRLRSLEEENERLKSFPPCCYDRFDDEGRGCQMLVDLQIENERLREALTDLCRWAEEARGHYGIEECAGPLQPATGWDDVQDGLRDAAMAARAALEGSEGNE